MLNILRDFDRESAVGSLPCIRKIDVLTISIDASLLYKKVTISTQLKAFHLVPLFIKYVSWFYFDNVTVLLKSLK